MISSPSDTADNVRATGAAKTDGLITDTSLRCTKYVRLVNTSARCLRQAASSTRCNAQSQKHPLLACCIFGRTLPKRPRVGGAFRFNFARFESFRRRQPIGRLNGRLDCRTLVRSLSVSVRVIDLFAGFAVCHVPEF